MIDPRAIFHHPRYLRSTFRRLEHLAALSLPLESRSVLEIGAGIGDLTSFYLDKGCRVTSVEPREQNVALFRERYGRDLQWEEGRLTIVQSTAEDLAKNGIEPHDVVALHQVFNFLPEPESAISFLASYANELLLLETACDSGEHRDGDAIRVREADPNDPGSSITGVGFLPTRRWVFNRLKREFPYVYVTLLQAHFDRFRLYWGRPDTVRGHDRVLFVASRSPLDNPLLADFIPTLQFHRLPAAADLVAPDGMRFVKTTFGPMLTVEGDRTWQLPYAEFACVLQLVNEGDLVHDFAAGIGMYAVALGIAVGNRGTVLATERRRPHIAALERNVRSHGTRNVHCGDRSVLDSRPAALVRIGAAEMSGADWRAAQSVIERDRPAVYADHLGDFESTLRNLGYTKVDGTTHGVLRVPSP